MNLKEIRTQFIKASGRYDLGIQSPDGTFVDNGANYYINAGQRLLESLVDLPKQTVIKLHTLSANSRHFILSQVFSVIKIYKIIDGKQIPLYYIPKVEFLQAFPTSLFGTVVSGSPLYYTILNSVEDTLNFQDSTILLNTGFVSDTILHIEYVKRTKMSSDTETTFYTENYPELSVYAACYQLEASYRNSEGMRDWLKAMEPILDGVDFSTILQMEQNELVARI